MSSIQALKVFISERLTAAAEEIFKQIEKTIVQYEEERDSQRTLLDTSWKSSTNTTGKIEPEDDVCISSQLPQMTVDIQPPSVQLLASPLTMPEIQTDCSHQTTLYLLDLCQTNIHLYWTNKHMFYRKLEQGFHIKGYRFTNKKIRKKLGNLLTTYRRNKARLTSTGDTKISWEYYLKMDKIFGDLGGRGAQVGTVVSTPLLGWIHVPPSTTLQLTQPVASITPTVEPSTPPKVEPSITLKVEPSTPPTLETSISPTLETSISPQPGPSTALLQPPARTRCSKRKKSEDPQDTYEHHAEQRTAARKATVYPDSKKRSWPPD